jgi:hypothetical protein
VTATLMAVQLIASVLHISLPGICNGDTECYKPTAQENVHQVISELLELPYKTDMSNRVIQLITYSQERDVDPFSETLTDLYGFIRPPGYGLFAMPEAWDHLHVAY